MQLNTLKRKHPHRDVKRVGRGRASGKGKTSGRGTKGQKARAGHKIWPNVREQIKKLPKLRGYNFAGVPGSQVVINVSTLERAFSAGDTVTPKVLFERGLVNARRGKTPPVKILGDGELTKKLTITGCTLSTTAKEKIEKAGGSVH